MANEMKDYDALVKRLMSTTRSVPTRAATVAVNFSKERFRRQNWSDGGEKAWEKRKQPKRGAKQANKRAILVKSGRLMRSIRKISSNADRAIIGTDVPYAQIHNDGGNVKATAQVGAYQKKAYKRRAHTRTRKDSTQSIAAHTVSSHTVKAHRRKMNFTMPQRQFIGVSRTLTGNIEDMITKDITKAIKGS
ncbi:phage virion morphogenesis protein [Pedobacter sp. WC2423]|uniref:phage virion morphogenesis protein n=1 Tax=Pedobacter sp. WC2423 TaxID=3234142 RepID=UPI003466C233